jgi:hypothetical protein
VRKEENILLIIFKEEIKVLKVEIKTVPTSGDPKHPGFGLLVKR